MIPKEQRDAARRICEAATKGPWDTGTIYPDTVYSHETSRPVLRSFDVTGGTGRTEDADFAADARNRWPDYIVALDEMERRIRERLQQHRENLALWREPDGPLIPTEPDPAERHLLRARLKAAIFELATLLGEEPGVEVS